SVRRRRCDGRPVILWRRDAAERFPPSSSPLRVPSGGLVPTGVIPSSTVFLRDGSVRMSVTLEHGFRETGGGGFFMKHTLLVAPVAFTVMMAMAGTLAYAQGGATSSITGTVTDASGAVIPGADIKAKNVATAAESTTVSAENGTFTIPALNAGTYTVTVSLM